MLEHLGLTVDEETVYRTILEEPAPRAELRDRLGLPANDVAAAIARLEHLGLVSASASPPAAYSAVSPDVALSRLQRIREDELAEQARAVDEGRAAVARFLLTVPQY